MTKDYQDRIAELYSDLEDAEGFVDFLQREAAETLSNIEGLKYHVGREKLSLVDKIKAGKLTTQDLEDFLADLLFQLDTIKIGLAELI